MQCVFALARKQKQAHCVIIHFHPASIPEIPDNSVFPFLSLMGFWHCLRAKVVFFDHATIPGITKNRRKCINLWHGIPIKNIRYFCKSSFPHGYLARQTRNTSLLISSSPVDRLAMTASFQMDPDQVIITGLPRNDILLDTKKYTRILPSLANELDSLQKLKDGKKLILYAPTYREANHNEQLLSKLTPEEEQTLSAILKKHNAILGIRSHIFSSKTILPSLFEHSLTTILPADTFTNTNLLLTMVDLLITDYSSIWVDFLLLERPILGFCPDLDEYLKQRGFLYDFQNIFPGPIASTGNELINNIDVHLQDSRSNTLLSNQDPICRMFHKHGDGKNTERVLKLVQRLE